jgi:hypothetical protein
MKERTNGSAATEMESELIAIGLVPVNQPVDHPPFL